MLNKRSGSAFFSAVLFAGFSATAHAEDDEDGAWRYRAEIITLLPVFGYEPATILSNGQDDPYDAAKAPERFLRFGGIIAVAGSYVAFDLRPYTDVRHDNNLRVRTGGLEARVSMPYWGWFVPGFYHHSSHNFSDGSYGFGTNLNSLYANVRLLDTSADLAGSSTRFELRTEAHAFLSRNASPHLLTDTAKVRPGESGETSWRGALMLDGRNRYGRTDASIVMNGDEDGRMASIMLDLPFMARIDPWFFGSLGDHLFLGPYVAVGWNRLYDETPTFGATVWSAGLRMDISIADTMH